MTQYNFEEFQELVEQFEPEMSLKSICEQEGVPYRAYITWRMNHGISKSRRKRPSPTGLIELEVENAPGKAAFHTGHRSHARNEAF